MSDLMPGLDHAPPSLNDLESAARLIYESMMPTPQYRWPLIDARLGARVLLRISTEFPPLWSFRTGIASKRTHRMPSFHPLLVLGVATYALELFRNDSNIGTIYVPVGMGSGLCGVIAARDALGLNTKVVAVVSAGAAAFAALLSEREEMRDDNVAVVVSGGNVDSSVYAGILARNRTERRRSESN